MTLSRVIVTAAEGPHAPMLELALPTFEHYAERFGYEIEVGAGDEAVEAGRPGPWRKIPLIRQALERYDLVLWLDTDVMILDDSRDIADELESGDYQGLVEQVSGDGRIPNTGVWLLRAGDRAQSFLRATWDEVELIDHMWTDQAAAVTVLGYDLAPWLPDASLARPCERRRESPYFPGTRLLPGEWNSLFFWMPVARPRFNHHAGGWPLERRLHAMSEDARGLPYHPLSGVPSVQVTASAGEPDLETERRYEAIERQLEAVLAPGDDFVVADEDQWRLTSRLAHRGSPFPHRDGTFEGRPSDDRTAIEEVERERERGTRVIAFVWPQLWWLDSYPDLRRHLRRRFRCIADTDTVVAFDLQEVLEEEDAGAPSLFSGMEDPDDRQAGLAPPSGRLAEVLADIASGRPQFVVQLGLEDWSLSVAIAYAWPYAALWGFGGDFETRERCRRLAHANGAAVERVKVQHRCEAAWLAAMTTRSPVFLATHRDAYDLLDPEAVPGLAQCSLLVKLHEADGAEGASRRFAKTHDLELLEGASAGDAVPPAQWAWLRSRTQPPSTSVAPEDHLGRLAATAEEVRFLHIGAHDGVTDERLERYIRRHGWRGLFVEPLPQLLAALRENYRDVDGLQFENSAIAESNGERLFFEVLPESGMPDWVRQVSSLRKDVILSHAEAVPGIERCIVARRIPCITVETLLDKHGIERVDLIVVDTEGYDYEILRQLDLNKLEPEVVIYEEKHLSLRDKHAARALLASAGYVVHGSGLNDCVAVLDPAARALP